MRYVDLHVHSTASDGTFPRKRWWIMPYKNSWQPLP